MIKGKQERSSFAPCGRTVIKHVGNVKEQYVCRSVSMCPHCLKIEELQKHKRRTKGRIAILERELHKMNTAMLRKVRQIRRAKGLYDGSA